MYATREADHWQTVWDAGMGERRRRPMAVHELIERMLEQDPPRDGDQEPVAADQAEHAEYDGDDGVVHMEG